MIFLTKVFSNTKSAIALFAVLAALYCVPASAANVLFVVNAPEDPDNPGALLLNSSDAWIKSHFNELLHTVTVVDDDAVTTASADGQGLIFISASVDATKVGTKFTDVNVPLVTFDVESQAFLKMTGPVANTDFGYTNSDVLHVEDKQHPLAAELTGNRNTVQKNVLPMGWGEPSASANVVARLIGGDQHACIYVYEAGDDMHNTTIAPERRIFFFMQDSVQLTDNGILLFDALIAYSLTISPASATVLNAGDAAEPETVGYFKISRAGSVANPLTVNYTVGAGTATAGVDYQALSGSVTIPAGSNNALVAVTPIDDPMAEGNETVLITITTGSGYNVGVVKNATVTIVDDDIAVLPSADAGPDVYANAAFTQTGVVGGALTIQWSQVSGPGTITFGTANAAVTTISASAEGVYVVRLLVTGNTGATASDTATITWDTTNPTITTVYGDLTAEATSPAGAAVTYPAASTNDNLSPVTVSYSHASGSTFALGTTTVTVTATDAAGNSASDTFDVTVVDTTGPAITVPADITVEATGPDGADVTFALPTASDLVDLNNVTVSTDPTSGSTFAMGTNVVTITAKDTRNNTSTATFNVIVVDTTDPVIAPFGNITAEATSAAGATVTFSPSASDSVDGSVTVTTDIASGSVFPLGTTTVTITATDDYSNSATATFTVTVVDTTPPEITVPDTIRQEPTDVNGAVVTFTASATDLVSAPANITLGYSHDSGDVFPIGTTTVTVTAADAAGNSSSKSFDIIIGDATPPVISVSNQTAEATGPTGAAVTFAPAPSALDAIDGVVAVTLSHASGSTFAIGVTEVTATATDAAGNTGTAKFNVTVTDLTGPAITGATDVTVEATSAAGAVVTFTPVATDIVDGAVTVTADPASGSVFALGETTVSLTATDAAGNEATSSFKVTVQDTTAPVIANVPADITIEADNLVGMAVTFGGATATDAVTASPVILYGPMGDSIFPIGTTTVTITATDAASNSSTETFDVTVLADATPPDIQSGPTAVPNPAKINQTVTFSCTATGAVSWDWAFGDGSESTGKSTGGATHAFAAAGTYTATVTATDASGLKTIRSLQVVVEAEALPPIDTDGDGTPDQFDSDDDNDGATDEEENTAGTDPLDATSVPKKPMTITKIAGSAKFNTPGRDQYSIAGIIPNVPTTFTPADKIVTVDLGGAIGVFKLDAKGRAKTSTGTFKLKLKYKRNKVTKKKDFVGGNVQFQAKLKGALGEKWKDEGVDPEKDKKKVTLPFVADLSFDGAVYTDKPNTVYSSKAKKSGAIKFSRKIKLR